jgi:WD40 repeat protein
LHHELETYRVPQDLVGKINDRGDTIPDQIFPVFRDEEELAGGDLEKNIREALQTARSLVVICSPRTPASTYVDQEIRIYKQLRAQESLARITPQRSEPLIAVIDGDPHAEPSAPDNCLPDSIRYQIDAQGERTDHKAPESLWVDFRLPDGTQGWTSRGAYRATLEQDGSLSNQEITERAERYHEQLETARLRIIAGILGVTLGALQDREVAYRLAQARQKLFESSFLLGSRTASMDQATAGYWRARYALAEDDDRLDAVHAIIRACAERLPLPLPHDQRVTDAAFTPDGATVISASTDGTVRFWKTTTGEPQGPPLVLASGAETLCVSPDGATLLVGTTDGEVYVSSIADRKASQTVAIGQEAITAVAFSADGSRFIAQAGSGDGSIIQVFDTASLASLCEHFVAEEVFPATAVALSPDGDRMAMGGFYGDIWMVPVAEHPSAPPYGAHSSPVDLVQYSPTGKHFVMVSGKSASMRDADTLAQLYDKISHGDQITAVAFSLDGSLIATGSRDRTARVWSVATGEPISPRLWHDGAVLCVSFDRESKRLLAGGEDQTVRLWTLPGGDPIHTISCESMVHQAAFSPDGHHVAYVTNGSVARLWEPDAKAPPTPPVGSVTHAQSVTRVAYDLTGHILLTGSADGTSRLWDGDSLEPLTGPLEQHNRIPVAPAPVITAVSISDDGTRVATGGGGDIDIWNTTTGKRLLKGLRHGNRLYSLRFSPDSKLLLSASGSGSARLWDASTGEPRGDPLEHEGLPSENYVLDARFSPNGRLVATAGKNGQAKLWDVEGKATLRHTIEHQGAVNSVAFSPDGSWLATGSDDHSARLWDVTTAEAVSGRLAHGGPVTGVAFSPDGKLLVTVSSDRTARMWDAVTGSPIGPPLQHPGRLRCTAFRHDSTMFATADDSGAARVWDSMYGIPITAWLQHPETVTSIAFHPEGRRVCTGCTDGSARVWSVAAHEADDPDGLRWYSEFKTAWSMEEERIGTPLGFEAWRQRLK